MHAGRGRGYDVSAWACGCRGRGVRRWSLYVGCCTRAFTRCIACNNSGIMYDDMYVMLYYLPTIYRYTTGTLARSLQRVYSITRSSASVRVSERCRWVSDSSYRWVSDLRYRRVSECFTPSSPFSLSWSWSALRWSAWMIDTRSDGRSSHLC